MTYARIGITSEAKAISTLFIGAPVVLHDNVKAVVRNVTPTLKVTVKTSSGKTHHIPINDLLELNPEYAKVLPPEKWI